MNLSETTQTLAVLGPIFGVISTALGIAVWVLKRHVQGKDEQIAQLKRERDDLVKELKSQEADSEAQLSHAQALHAKLKVDLDVASADLIHTKAGVKPLQEALIEAQQKYKEVVKKALHNYDAWKREKEVREKTEAQVKALTGQVKTLVEEKAAILVQLQAARTTAEQAIQAHAVVEKQKATAHQKAKTYFKKAKALEGQLAGVLKQDGRVWHKPIPAGVPPFIPLKERATPIISVLNLKGGVGKTTITANLAGYLSEVVGKRVLMIDLDHQRSLSQMVMSDVARKAAVADGCTVQHFLRSPTRDGQALVAAAAAIPGLTNCWITTAADPQAGKEAAQSLDDLEMQLLGQWLVTAGAADVRFLMRNALHSAAVREKFDYVFLDCPPRLTTACISALTASDFVLIPVQAEAVSARSVQHLLIRLRELREAEVLADLRVLGLVANMVSSKVDEKGSHEAKLLEQVATAAGTPGIWGREVKVLGTKLLRVHHYAEATKELHANDPLKLAVEYPSIRRQYQDLMKDIEGRINESLGVAGVSS